MCARACAAVWVERSSACGRYLRRESAGCCARRRPAADGAELQGASGAASGPAAGGGAGGEGPAPLEEVHRRGQQQPPGDAPRSTRTHSHSRERRVAHALTVVSGESRTHSHIHGPRVVHALTQS